MVWTSHFCGSFWSGFVAGSSDGGGGVTLNGFVPAQAATSGMCTSANDVWRGRLHTQSVTKFGTFNNPSAGMILLMQPERMLRRRYFVGRSRST
jgi:hypothetical protein